MYFKDTACFCRCAYFLRSRSGHGHARVNCSLVTQVIRNFWTEYFLVKGGDSTAPLRLGFDSWSLLHTWVEFVVRRFLSGMFSFPPAAKSNTLNSNFGPETMDIESLSVSSVASFQLQLLNARFLFFTTGIPC